VSGSSKPAAAGNAELAAAFPLLSDQTRQLIEHYRFGQDGAGAPVERTAAAILIRLRGHRDASTSIGQVHAYLDILRAGDSTRHRHA
jgi:hypothetical protein